MTRFSKRGFSIVEIIVTIAIFVLFAAGIYGGIQFTFKVVFNSRVRILETGILNEQIEIIRNLPFHSVGIVNGSPSGLLERTVTTTRSGIDFVITRTIRNIDDPFDGLIGGGQQGGGQCQQGKVEVCHNGNTLCISSSALPGHLGHGDTAGPCGGSGSGDNQPADYKLVEVEIICAACTQKQPLRMSTYVAPKFLEGNPDNGAMLISVFDANGVAVEGATIHVIATSTSSTVNLTDVSNTAGDLTIVDLPAGVGAYNITVTKNGYTTDRTVTSSTDVPNPVKPPASVVAQDLTAISFAIDKVSQINLDTLDTFCNPIGSVPVDFVGTKLIGTNPNILITSTTVATGGLGAYTFGGLVWDTYRFRASGFDLLGSIPPNPVTIGPNVTQNVDLVLGANTANSLLVTVLDSVTKQPVANATVRVTSTSYDVSKATGVGAVTQTNWSGGAAQEHMSDVTRYWADDGGVETLTSPGDVTLKQVGQNYVTSGNLTSSIYDLVASPSYVNITWNPTSQPAETGSTSLRFQIATSNSSTPASWNYLGPDGTSATYYDITTPNIHTTHDNQRYMRYKAYLSTDTATSTPTLSDVSLSYTTSCTPPGQSYFGSLSNQSYSVEVTKSGYQTHVTSFTVSGDSALTVNLVSS